MVHRLIAIVLVSCMLCFGMGLKQPGLGVEKVTEQSVFVGVGERDFIGTGFFVTLEGGQEIFVYCVPGDDPNRIENSRRVFLALAKGVGSVLPYTKSMRQRLYLMLRSDLNAENRLLYPEDYPPLVQRTVQQEMSRDVLMVHFPDVKISGTELQFSAAEIKSIGPLTRTTGGSLVLFMVNRLNGDPISIGMGASEEGAEQKIHAAREKFKLLIGSEGEITAHGLQYLDPMYTFDGAHRCWSVHLKNVSGY